MRIYSIMPGLFQEKLNAAPVNRPDVSAGIEARDCRLYTIEDDAENVRGLIAVWAYKKDGAGIFKHGKCSFNVDVLYTEQGVTVADYWDDLCSQMRGTYTMDFDIAVPTYDTAAGAFLESKKYSAGWTRAASVYYSKRAQCVEASLAESCSDAGSDEDIIVQELSSQAASMFPGITEATVRDVVLKSGLSAMSLEEARKKYIDVLMQFQSM